MKIFKDRNYTIDFLRGCACIFIILIHTAWWSGQKYLPSWFSNLFLLVDVPIFVFLSGLSYNYFESIGKNIKGILKQWNKWVFFLIFYMLILYIFFRSEFDLTKLVGYIFYQVPSTGSLQVVGGSIWFITMYIKVTLFCSVILFFYKKYNTLDFKYILMFMILLSVLNIAFIDYYVAIYSFIYLLGYYSYKNKIKSLNFFFVIETILIISIMLLFMVSGYTIKDIQMLKFPPTIYYLMISMPGIILTWFLKDQLKISKDNPLCYLGKNSIFFYFSQGISSSILYFIVRKVSISNIYFKFFVMAICNIFMAIIIGIILNELYDAFVLLIKKLKPHINKLFML